MVSGVLIEYCEYLLALVSGIDWKFIELLLNSISRP